MKPTFLAFFLLATVWSSGEPLDAALQAKVEQKLAAIKSWGSDSAIIEGVRKHNAGLADGLKGLDNDKWKAIGGQDDLVRGLTRNAVAERLKALKDPTISECFVSGADGKKVAFLSKTTSWSHAGKAKHEQPMAGKIWIGPVEVDESSGVKQVQVAFPVLDGKAIGSVVVGLNLARL
ncbi:MAG: PDC sensor domain-containing protein [Spirochaetes bacterium]|nr:PDC sensor domain-containing protein [Spirochaetota bacterium]